MQIIKKYFADLSEEQFEKIGMLNPLYDEWNSRINVISRKDMEFFYLRHVLHSMSVLKFVDFIAGTRILDVGTGGGFPGIPLAISRPEVEFLLVDSVGKKIKVVNEVVRSLGLDNVRAVKSRAEDLQGEFDFIVSRAVKPLPQFMSWVSNRVSSSNLNAIPNGILYLKGGEFAGELSGLGYRYRIYNLHERMPEEYFRTKKLVHLYNNV